MRLTISVVVIVFIHLGCAAQIDRGKFRNFTKQTIERDGTAGYYDNVVRKYFKRGQWQEGKKVLDKGMESYYWLSSLNELEGQYWLHYRQYDKARYYLIRSLKDDASNTHSKEMLAKIEEETKNYSAAIVYINELLEANPYNYSLWKKKISLYRLQGNNEEA